VIKPSELCLLQTQVLIEALHEADLPKGLLNVVTGLGSIVGAELVRNPDVAKISFTGSVDVGEGIMREGVATMKRVTLRSNSGLGVGRIADREIAHRLPYSLLDHVQPALRDKKSGSGRARLTTLQKRHGQSRRDGLVERGVMSRTVGDFPPSLWCRKNSMSACNPTFAKASKKALKVLVG
jgi:hypothetical protein